MRITRLQAKKHALTHVGSVREARYVTQVSQCLPYMILDVWSNNYAQKHLYVALNEMSQSRRESKKRLKNPHGDINLHSRK